MIENWLQTFSRVIDGRSGAKQSFVLHVRLRSRSSGPREPESGREGGLSGFAMLTRSAAEAAAAAAAAVVASAASAASEATRGLHGRRRAGRCLPAKHTRARPTRTGAILASLKKQWAETRDYAVTSMEYAVAFRGVPTGAPPAVQASRCLGRSGGRGGDDRGSGSRGGLGS